LTGDLVTNWSVSFLAILFAECHTGWRRETASRALSVFVPGEGCTSDQELFCSSPLCRQTKVHPASISAPLGAFSSVEAEPNRVRHTHTHTHTHKPNRV